MQNKRSSFQQMNIWNEPLLIMQSIYEVFFFWLITIKKQIQRPNNILNIIMI